MPAGTTSNAYAIAGLGVTEQGRLDGRHDLELKADAVELALADAGLASTDVDGFIFQPGITDIATYGRGGEVVKEIGLTPNFVWSVQSGGTSAIAAIAMAVGAISSGLASCVVIAFGDTPLSNGVVVGKSGMHTGGASDLGSSATYGMFSAGANHALAAQRHMSVFGTTREHLGAVALTARDYANQRPDAMMHGRPLAMDDYLAAPMVAEPLGRYDYCLIADGGTALVVTTAERARDMARPPVAISGMGLSTSFGLAWERTQYHQVGVTGCRDTAFTMADITVDDIDVAQLYDCFTITTLLSVEGYGFCKQGEGGPFIAEGNLGPGGAIPTNTAGGELSWGYQQGFTPLIEGIRQLRGDGGATQVPHAQHCLVTGHGSVVAQAGHMDYAEGCLILSNAS